jgi:hypothetical protein
MSVDYEKLKEEHKENLTDYLDEAMSGFEHDPPDSDFQRGYLAALREVAKTFTNLKIEDYNVS